MSILRVEVLPEGDLDDDVAIERWRKSVNEVADGLREVGFQPQIQMHAIGGRLIATVAGVKIRRVDGAVLPVSESEWQDAQRGPLEGL